MNNCLVRGIVGRVNWLTFPPHSAVPLRDFICVLQPLSAAVMRLEIPSVQFSSSDAVWQLSQQRGGGHSDSWLTRCGAWRCVVEGRVSSPACNFLLRREHDELLQVIELLLLLLFFFLIRNLDNKVPRVWAFTKRRERIFQLWVMNATLISSMLPDLITSLSKSNLSQRAMLPRVYGPKVKPPYWLPAQTC